MSNFMSLDLEFNQPSLKICQVGITIANIKTEEILLKKSWFIKINEELNPFIMRLCGISQEHVDNGITLENCYKELCELHSKFTCFRNPIVWGGGDSEALRKQLNLDYERFVFGRRWIDTKTLYTEWRTSQNKSRQAALKKALINMGTNFIGKTHNAEFDSLNCIRIYFLLLRKFRS